MTDLEMVQHLLAKANVAMGEEEELEHRVEEYLDLGTPEDPEDQGLGRVSVLYFAEHVNGLVFDSFGAIVGASFAGGPLTHADLVAAPELRRWMKRGSDRGHGRRF